MADPRKAAFNEYIRHLADRMELRDWSVGTIADLPDNPEAYAGINCCYGRKIASVKLTEKFLADADRPERQRQAIVHELMHCHFEPAWETVADWLPEDKLKVFVRLMEYGIDAAADALAPHLPLPLKAEG